MKARKLGWAARAAGILAASAALAGCVTLEFSPDGSRIAFVWADGKSNISIVRTDGTEFRIVPGSVESAYGHWAPDGESLVFTSEKGLMRYHVGAHRTTEIKAGSYADSAWVDARTLVALRGPLWSLGEPEIQEFQWIDVRSGEIRQRIPLRKEDPDSAMYLSPVPKTNGVLFLASDDLYVAEFGSVRRVTTTGDVCGFRLRADGNRVLYARRTKNPTYILLSLYEFDLSLRSVRKLPFPNHVAGVNPRPRVGPSKVQWVYFSEDCRWMSVHAAPQPEPGSSEKPRAGDLYWVAVDGSKGTRVFSSGSPLAEAIGMPAPDAKAIAVLHGDQKRLRLELVGADGRSRRLLRELQSK